MQWGRFFFVSADQAPADNMTDAEAQAIIFMWNEVLG